jgi:hypothetical protein
MASGRLQCPDRGRSAPRRLWWPWARGPARLKGLRTFRATSLPFVIDDMRYEGRSVGNRRLTARASPFPRCHSVTYPSKIGAAGDLLPPHRC